MPRQCQLVWAVAVLFAGLLVVGIDNLLAPIARLLVGELLGWYLAALCGLGAAALICKGYWRRLPEAFPRAGMPALIAMLPVVVLPLLAVTTLLHAWASLAEPVSPYLAVSQLAFLASIIIVIVFVFLQGPNRAA